MQQLSEYCVYNFNIIHVLCYYTACVIFSTDLLHSEDKVLRRIFGPKRVEVTGEWRKLRNEELTDPYCSPNIVWVINSRRMRWEGQVARMGRGEVYTGL